MTVTLFHSQAVTLNQQTFKYVPGPPHLHSCTSRLTSTVHLAEALPLPIWCQSNYRSFIWSCVAR